MSKPELSIIIPTLNEAKNIAILIKRIFAALNENHIYGEIIIMDDKSPDGTAEIASKFPVRVYLRGQREGLGPAIMDGIKLANAPTLCVIDADLSHPPEAIPHMFKLIKEKKALLVIGSRHTKGGGTSEWIWYRRLFSWGARTLGKLLTPVKDLTSGFFMFDRKILENVEINPLSCKVGLELMIKAKHQNKIREYPIIFLERAAGESKMGWHETKIYLKHLLALGWHKLKTRNPSL